jgi:hypothetical protein
MVDQAAAMLSGTDGLPFEGLPGRPALMND